MQGPARFAAFLLVFSLTACGSGSSSSRNSSSPPPSTPPTLPPVPPPPGPGVPLAFDADNAAAVVQTGFAFPEQALQVVEIALEGFRTIHEIGPGIVGACLGGSWNASFDDVNADLTPGPGDSVSIHFSNCQREDINHVINGTVQLSIEHLVVEEALGMLLEGSIAFPDEFTVIPGDAENYVLQGKLMLSINSTLSRESLEISTPAGESFAITSVGQTEQVSGLQIHRELKTSPYEYHLDFEANVRSEQLNGTFECTGTNIVGQPLNNPHTGQVNCHGANNGLVTLKSSDENGGPLQLDEDGSGTFSTLAEVQSWLDMVEFKTLEYRTLEFQWLYGRLPAVDTLTSLEIEVNDVALNTRRGEIYVANTSGIVILDAVSLQVKQTVDLPDLPRVIALNEDKSELYIGYTNDSVIQVLNTDDLSLAAPFDLGNGTNGNEAFAEGIVHLGENLIAVSMDRGFLSEEGVAIFENGIRKPSIAPGTSHIAKTANGRLFGFNNENSQNPLTEVILEPNGAYNGKEIAHAFGGFGRQIFAAGNRIVSSHGAVVRFDERELVAQMRTDRFTNSSVFAYSNQENRFYAASIDAISVFDGASYAPVSHYRISMASPPVEVLVSEHHVALVAQDEIVLIEKTTLADYPLRPCDSTPLSLFGSNSGTIAIECDFVDAVYDQTSGRILAGVGPFAGGVGNSIAQIDPQTGTIEKFIPLGYEPKRFARSANGVSLYAITENSNAVIALDLNSEEVTPVSMLLSGTTAKPKPEVAKDLSASPVNDSDLIVAHESFFVDTILLSGGTVAANRAKASFVGFDDVDGGSAYAFDREDLIVLDVDSGGLTTRSSAADLLDVERFKVKGGKIFTPSGNRINPELLSIDQTFDVPRARVVEVDPTTSEVLFFPGSYSDIVFFDTESGALSGDYDLPLEYSVFQPVQLLADLPDHVVLVGQGSMLIIPKAEIYAQ